MNGSLIGRVIDRAFARGLLAALAIGFGCAQEPPAIKQDPLLDDGSMPTFGVTTVSSSGLHGQIYFIREGSVGLPNFKKMKPVGSIYTNSLHVPPRDFLEGFPGITDRLEWFAIDYTGRFWIEQAGKYKFALVSDDGSKLYIDNKTVIDNDGLHSTLALYGAVKLERGIHNIRVSYYQGPGNAIALVLAVMRPDQKDYFVFDMRNFRPPKDLLEPAAEGKP